MHHNVVILVIYIDDLFTLGKMPLIGLLPSRVGGLGRGDITGVTHISNRARYTSA